MYMADAVYLYLLVLHEILAENGDYRNGSLIFEKAIRKSFQGTRIAM